MRRYITKLCWAEQSDNGWVVFASHPDHYPFTIAGSCSGFSSFTTAKRFATSWIAACTKQGYEVYSAKGRGLATKVRRAQERQQLKKAA